MLRKRSQFDRRLRRANLAAWLMADESPVEDDESWSPLCGDDQAAPDPPAAEVDEIESENKRPRKSRSFLNRFSRGSR